MADQDTHRGLLWMFRRNAPEEGGAALDASGSLYTLFKNTQNPYLKRAIAPNPRAADPTGQTPSGQRAAGRTEGELSRLVQFFGGSKSYQVALKNRGEPFQRRQLKHPPPAPGGKGTYQDARRLPGDPVQLPFLVEEFFGSILSRLRADPQSFDDVVQELTALFQEHGITLRIYEAYHALEDWDDLMGTLDEIARYPSVETFDLFCSALLAYHDLVYGEG
jgi:hypothetical protein